MPASKPHGNVLRIFASAFPRHALFLAMWLYFPAVVAASTPFGRISLTKIQKDIVGQTVAGIPWEKTRSDHIAWQFEKGQKRDIKILREEAVDNENLSVWINLHTEQTNRNRTWKSLRGDLHLHYLRVSDGWLLTKISNVSFSYLIHSASNEILPGILADEQFLVEAGRAETRYLTVQSKSRVIGAVSVVGGKKDIIFRIAQGGAFKDYDTRAEGGKATIDLMLGPGEYSLTFSNNAVSTKKTVRIYLKAYYE